MFDGESIVMQKEVIRPNRSFLVRNGALPWAHDSFAIPLISRVTKPEKVLTIADEIFENVTQHVNVRKAHQIRFVYRRDWQSSTEQQTRQAIRDLCTSTHTQIKAYDVSREMFAARGDVHTWGLLSNRNQPRELIDILFGVSTRLGDGQRYHLGNGQWGFSQMKGLRTHTGSFYVRGNR